MIESGYAPPARFSHDRKYRYLLTRQVRPINNGVVTFVMLNPSTADETQDDPTIRRCIGFADRRAYNWLFVVNLSPLRATNPKELLAAGSEPDRVWDTNMACIQEAATKSDLVVAAWGAHGGGGGPGCCRHLTFAGQRGPDSLPGHHEGLASEAPAVSTG